MGMSVRFPAYLVSLQPATLQRRGDHGCQPSLNRCPQTFVTSGRWSSVRTSRALDCHWLRHAAAVVLPWVGKWCPKEADGHAQDPGPVTTPGLSGHPISWATCWTACLHWKWLRCFFFWGKGNSRSWMDYFQHLTCFCQKTIWVSMQYAHCVVRWLKICLSTKMYIILKYFDSNKMNEWLIDR